MSGCARVAQTQMAGLYPFADSTGCPAILVIHHEELPALVDDDEVAVRLVRRIREIGGEIEEARAVRVHGVRSCKCPLHEPAVESSYLAGGKLTLAVEDNPRHRGEKLAAHLLPLELDSVGSLQGPVRALPRTGAGVSPRTADRTNVHGPNQACRENT